MQNYHRQSPIAMPTFETPHNGVWIFCNATPVPHAGIINRAVVKNIVFRPPAKRIKNALGMRKVAPEIPAIAIKVNRSGWAKRKIDI